MRRAESLTCLPSRSASTKTRTANTPSTTRPRNPTATANIGQNMESSLDRPAAEALRGGVQPQGADPAAGEQFDDPLPGRLADRGLARGAGERVEGGPSAGAYDQTQRARGELETPPAVRAARPEHDRRHASHPGERGRH